MNALKRSLPACLASLLLLIASAGGAQRAGQTDEPWRAGTRPKNLKTALQKIEALEAEVARLQTKIASMQVTNQTLRSWVQWQHFILENRDEIAKQLEPKWQQNRQAFFSMAGGKGNLREIEIEEIAFYKGLIIVPTGYFTVFSDGSGAVGRMAVAIDPAKDFEVVSCTLDDEVKTFSAQDILKLANGSRSDLPVANLPKPERTFKVEISPEAKNALINGGIMVGVGILTKMLTGN